MGREFQHFVGTVAEHELVAADLQARGELAGEIPAAAVRVKVHLAQRGGSGRQRLRRGAERVFVGGQLVDPRRIKAEFPRHLRDRLARLVDRLVQDVGLGETCGVHGGCKRSHA